MRPLGSSPTTYRFIFRGSGFNFYRVFIVNSTLSILTLGIYSAWAKVRTKRFFLGNTMLHGHAFDFDANPIGILISRALIITIIFLVAKVDESYNLLWAGLGLGSLALTFAYPLALVRGRAFNARHTIHRTVRFSYTRVYLPAFILFVLLFAVIVPFLYGLTFLQETSQISSTMPAETLNGAAASLLISAITMPAFMYYRHKIQIDQLKFGTIQLRYTATLGKYYLLYLIPYTITAGMCFVLYLFLDITFNYGTPNDSNLIHFVVLPLLFLLVFLLYMFMRALITRTYWESIALSDGSNLKSDVTTFGLLVNIIILNYILIIISLGVFYPWAKVREWRYITHKTSFVASPEFVHVFKGTAEEISALADELAPMAGFDIDFGTI